MRYNLNIDDRIKLSQKVIGENFSLPVCVPFVGSFTEDSAKKFRESLEMAENMAKDSKQEIIPVTIDSYGGSVYALMGMIDAIRSCSIPIATIVESKAMSCGAMLFSYGAEGHRYVGEHATVMIHPVSSGAIGKVDDIKASVEEANRLNALIFKEVARNCGHKDNYFLDELKERRMADWYLSPKECVKHGLANHVKIPSISVDIEVRTQFG